MTPNRASNLESIVNAPKKLSLRRAQATKPCPEQGPAPHRVQGEARELLRLPRLRAVTPIRQKGFSVYDHFGVQARASPSQRPHRIAPPFGFATTIVRKTIQCVCIKFSQVIGALFFIFYLIRPSHSSFLLKKKKTFFHKELIFLNEMSIICETCMDLSKRR